MYTCIRACVCAFLCAYNCCCWPIFFLLNNRFILLARLSSPRNVHREYSANTMFLYHMRLSVCVCVCKNGHLKWLFLFSSIYLKSFGLTCLRHYFIRYGEKKLRIPKQTEAATEKTLKNWHGNSLMLDKWNYLVWVLRSKSASLPVPFRWWWCCCSFGSCCFCYFLWKITTFWRYLSLVFFCLSVSLHICKICFVFYGLHVKRVIYHIHTHTHSLEIFEKMWARVIPGI